MKFLIFFILLTFHFIGLSQFGPLKDVSKGLSGINDAMAVDIDGDGNLDILCISNSDDKISWFENLGNGDFGVQQIISDQIDNIEDLFAADLDGDGDMDVLVASTKNYIGWFENVSGVFGALDTISTLTNYAVGIQAADLDGDGDIDVISASTNDDKIAWYENDGTGSFGTQQVIFAGSDNPTSIYTADVDGDGDIDILCSYNIDDKITWHSNLGGGNFGPEQVITNTADFAQRVYAADLDNDGNIDVLSASENDNKIAWYQNLGGGSFGSEQIISLTADGAVDVTAADLDGDSDLDIISTSVDDNKIAWYENLGGGVFGAEQIISNTASYARFATPADLDNDGAVDIISVKGFGNFNKLAWYKNMGGIFNEHIINVPSVHRAFSVFSSDLDGDGDQDLLSASFGDNKISWYENLGYGQFGPQQVLSDTAGGARSIFATDLDGDGDPDLIAALDDIQEIVTFENFGGGNFGPQQTFDVGLTGACTVIGTDIDSDGDMDIFAADFSGDQFVWYENIGGGTFGAQQLLGSNANGASGLRSFDLDGDGDQDILFTVFFGDQVGWFENLGGGSFSSAQIITSATNGAWDAYAADLDGDNDLDVISCSETDDKIAWYENLGGGNFGPQQMISTVVNNNARSVMASDLDGDGDMDIIAGYAAVDKIVWFENLGNGTFSPEIDLGIQIEIPICIITADLDSDGDPEVIFAGDYDSKIGYFENHFKGPYKLSGSVFYDSNQNKIMEINEPKLNFFPLAIQPTPMSSFTNGLGSFSFFVDTNTYIVAPVVNYPHWGLTTDSISYTRTLSTVNPLEDSLDFGFYPDTFFTHIEPVLTGGFPRCFAPINFWVTLQNYGTTLPSGIIDLHLDTSLTFVNSAHIPDSISGDHIYWHYDSLMFNGIESFDVQLLMPPLVYQGQVLNSFLNVTELDSVGNIVYSSSDTLSQVMVCAYDPNDKSVTPQGIGIEGYIKQNVDLEYLIRFQNTGTDTALVVEIRDQLDSNLDWSTLQPLASSHPVQVSVESDGEAVFFFDNIMLPDSNVNESASNGFIKFRIKQNPNLASGTKIFNKGYIYFDFNPAIITNPVVNTIYNCSFPPINTETTVVCINEELNVSTFQHDSSTYNWTIENVTTSSLPDFTWESDTAGVFELSLNVNNPLCSTDTSIFLTVLLPDSVLFESQQICQGDSILLGGAYQSTTGVYVDFVSSNEVCPIVINTTLTINPTTNSNQSFTICQGEGIDIFGTVQTTAGVYLNTLQSIEGCDSIVSTTLTVLSVFAMTQAVSICNEDSLFFGGSYVKTAGTYYDTLQTIFGCDSVIIMDLSVYNQPTGIDIQVACDSYTWMDGNTYTADNNLATFNIQGGSINGCDSLVELNLTINSIDSSVIQTDDITLQATTTGAVYQWLDCNDNYNPISGETNQSLIATLNGNYAVQISESGCIDTSACFLISSVGIIENDFGSSFLVSPNPTDRIVTIELGNSYENVSVRVFNMTGQLIQEFEVNETNKLEVELNGANGLYSIEIESVTKKAKIKVLKNSY